MQIIHDNEDGSLKSRLSVLDQALNALSADDPNLAEYVDALRQFRSTLDELTRNLNKPPLHNINADEVESRLFALSQLKRKLNRSLPEILTLRDEIEETVSFLDSCGLDIKQAEKERNQILEKLAESLDILNEQRKKAADGFCSALKVQLEALGFMDHVRVLAEFTPNMLAPGCIEERCRFLWAPNPGQAPQPLDHIASGGELSRFLLAVITLQAQHEDATLIFDEIDAGVGGITLNRVAEALSELADKRQMLLITHWPQLAARAKAHFQVNKEVIDNETFTRCIRLDGAAREVELARMAGIEN
jgi:DNA repair protein RecN (Recombination protein N)